MWRGSIPRLGLTITANAAFFRRAPVPYWDMPRSIAQLTGILVTAIVTFGTDLDTAWSIPLGVFAGAMAIFFVSMSEARHNYDRQSRLLQRIKRR
jgi:hypothetical protein